MTIEFDEKGKIFTEVITKDAVLSEIQTRTHRVRGFVHVRRGARLSDEINRAEKFLAVTDATIYDAANQPLYSVKFLAINCDQVVWLAPWNEITPLAVENSPRNGEVS